MRMRTTLIVALAIFVSGCATAPDPKDFSAFRSAQPRSLVVVPVIDHSEEAEAGDFFLTTLSTPLAERGYYVFPTNMVKGLMEREGLSDAQLVHSADTTVLAGLFGADAVIYVEILTWKPTYSVVATGVEVGFLYTIKDGKTGALLWQEQRSVYVSQSGNSGNIIADLIANAVVAAANEATADYTSVAVQANAIALQTPGQGIPYGPYSPQHGKDNGEFPSTGVGNLSNAQEVAVSHQVPLEQKAKPAPNATETPIAEADEGSEPAEGQPTVESPSPEAPPDAESPPAE